MTGARVLDDAPWLRSGPAARVLELLNSDGEEARVVGGAVRNTLMKIPTGDIDIATSALPDEVIRRAAAASIKSVPTGIEHGTVTLVVEAQPFEVTTLREDTETFGRKATEAVMAMRLEARYSKEDILVAYLNEVYLGQDGARAIHGFGLGSEYYFAKPLDELEPAELALLIGLVKGPSLYDPRKHPDRALARRNLVLKEFADAHLIDAQTAKRALASPLGLRPPGGTYVPAYIDLVRRHLKRDYAEADLAAAGLGRGGGRRHRANS